MTALFILLCNLLRLLLSPIRFLVRSLRGRMRARYVRLCLPERLSDLPAAPGSPWQALLWRVQRRHATDLRQLQKLFHQLAKDPARDGVVVQVGTLHASWSVIGAMRSALLLLREQGKRVVVNLVQGGDEKVLYLVTAADEVALCPAASLTFAGLAFQGLYVRDLLSRLGVAVEVNAQGSYKTAAETLVRAEMSPAQREQTEALLTARQALVDQALATRLPEGQQVAPLLKEVTLTPERARELGLVQHSCYEDELAKCLKQEDLGARWLVEAPRYRALRPRPLWRPLRPGSRIEILPLMGTIRERGSAGGRMVALASTVAAVRDLRRDKRVAGVLLYINSPGGSAMVSDLIHHEIQRLAVDKPVVAYFADVAASGGYYIAVPARRIVAAPEAITGSIGVVSVKPVVQGLMDRLGIGHSVVRTGPHADMMSLTRSMDEAEQAIVDRESQRIYRRFLEVVAEGRNMAFDAVEAVAGGRVWSAQSALSVGLVDRLGTLEDALSELKGLITPAPPRPIRVAVHAAQTRRQPWAPVEQPEERSQLWTRVLAGACDLTSLFESHERHLCLWLEGQRDCSN